VLRRASALLTRPCLAQQLGEDFDERVLPSIANEVLKAVVVRLRCVGCIVVALSLTWRSVALRRRSSTRTSC
jgi:hypothetical protein